jgi:hypothetical protein
LNESVFDPALVRRLGFWVTTVSLLAALAFTLYPYRFDLHVASVSRIDWHIFHPGHSNRDLVINLVMLIPLGAGLAMLRFGHSLLRIAIEALALGLGTALVIETLQIFEATRYPQLADVVRNGVSCLAGALAVTVLVRTALTSATARSHRRA